MPLFVISPAVGIQECLRFQPYIHKNALKDFIIKRLRETDGGWMFPIQEAVSQVHCEQNAAIYTLIETFHNS